MILPPQPASSFAPATSTIQYKRYSNRNRRSLLYYGFDNNSSSDSAITAQVKNFCNKNNIEIIEAPVNDHCAIGLVERLIQTIKSRLACIREETSASNAFHIKYAKKIILQQLRICKQRTTNISPFEAHFGRKPNIPLSVISTKPNSSNISCENILSHYLDEDTVTPEDILLEKKWING